MWRLKTFPCVADSIVHYLSPERDHLYFYDVMNQVQTDFELDFIMPKYGRSVVVGKESIYFMGGYKTNQTMLFNTTDNTMTDKKSMIFNRRNFATAYDNQMKEIYVFGGIN